MTSSDTVGQTDTAESSSSLRHKPQKGETVVDNNRLIEQEGVIAGIVYDFTDPINEVITEVSVRFNRTDKGTVGYGPEKFTTWDGEKWVID